MGRGRVAQLVKHSGNQYLRTPPPKELAKKYTAVNDVNHGWWTWDKDRWIFKGKTRKYYP